MPSSLISELTSFRQQWLSDIHAHKRETSVQSKATSSLSSKAPKATSPTTSKGPSSPKATSPTALNATSSTALNATSPPNTTSPLAPSSPPPRAKPPQWPHGSYDETTPPATEAAPARKLVSALDYFEAAMDKEAQGDMGESVQLYRTAYKLDSRVDTRYREKHAATIPSATTSATKPSTVTSPPQHLISTTDLIASFSNLTITPAPAPVDGDPVPPCPLAALPYELHVLILTYVAASDPGDLLATALSCKPLAYLIFFQAHHAIWRAAALSPRFGFPAMPRHFRCRLDRIATSTHDLNHSAPPAEETIHDENILAASLIPSPYSSWMHMFRARPRIRFNGCYISTVNYVRSGFAHDSNISWSSCPIHLVTYYRYLRFLPNGCVLSLLSSAAPIQVVHNLSLDLVHAARAAVSSSSNPLYSTLFGRWRLSDDDALVHVETEGVGPKYLYRMVLSLRSSSAATARNTRLRWCSFCSYNKRTEDWAEFDMGNGSAYIFSRVRSYGMGC